MSHGAACLLWTSSGSQSSALAASALRETEHSWAGVLRLARSGSAPEVLDPRALGRRAIEPEHPSSL
jgi:hypothetical protein